MMSMVNLTIPLRWRLRDMSEGVEGSKLTAVTGRRGSAGVLMTTSSRIGQVKRRVMGAQMQEYHCMASSGGKMNHIVNLDTRKSRRLASTSLPRVCLLR